MFWIVLGITLTGGLFWFARLRGALLGIALTVFAFSVVVLSRFHIRKSVLVLVAIVITAMVVGIVAEVIKMRKKQNE